MAVLAVYEDWAQVPWFLVSKSQLASGDLPRLPAGSVDAHVRSYRRGRQSSVGLYHVERSRPTAASAGQLEASARRRTLSAHVCLECGACCDRSLAVREGERLCPMCWRMREVASFQGKLRGRRGDLERWAREMLGDPRLAVVWVDVVSGGRTASGRVRPAAAAVVTAVDGGGRRLVDVVVRFAGVGGHGVPRGACSPAEGAVVLGRVLGGRRVLAWTEAQVSVLSGRLEGLGLPLRLEVISSQPGAGWDGWPMSVRDRVAQWRGQLDPATGALLPAWEPGRADRLRLLLARMAEGDVGGA